MPFHESNISELSEKLIFFLDLDGTIYLENKLFKGVPEFLKLLRERNKQFYFLSNNSSLSTSAYLEKLNKFNLHIVEDNLILSQHPTIEYLKKEQYKKIFLLGTTSLKREFENEGFELTERDPQIIVLAFDKELTYERLVRATKLLLKKDFPYIATHLDNRCPTEEGYIPDAGGIAALLFRTVERMPRVFGKPNKEMLLFKLNQLGLSPKDAVMIGDRLYTDIKMGKNAGVSTCLCLSGETTMDMIKNSEDKPDFVVDGIWDLQNAFSKI